MATRVFGGAWARQAARNEPIVPLKPPIDPAHAATDANPNVVPGALPDWVQTQAAPDLPTSLYSGDGYETIVATGAGLVSGEPRDHAYGTGAGHALSQEEARAIATSWGSRDLGTVAATDWMPETDRDGQYELEWIGDPGADQASDSPVSLELERTGIGRPNDPHARSGRRLARWVDRVIDMHWFDVNYRPATVRVAYTAQEQPPVTGGGPLDSPWATPAPFRATPDALVAQEVRRQPQPWQIAATGDGSAQAFMTSTDQFGLPSWGL